MPEKTLFVAQGGMAWASSRYRAWWITKYASWADCKPIAQIAQGDFEQYANVVWPKPCAKAQRMTVMKFKDAGARIFWDICDPMHWLSFHDTEKMLDTVDEVVVSNQGLANEMYYALGVDTHIIEDRMCPEFHPTTKGHEDTPAPTLLWYGNCANRVPSLSGAVLGLTALVNRGVCFRLRILDDGVPGGVGIVGIDTEYHPWRLDTFHQELIAADVALCPDYPPPWGLMKSNNKEVSAWWAGLPVVKLDSWDDAERAVGLLTDYTERQIVGEANAEYARHTYDVRQSVYEWEQIL